jgi:predicted amidohydrolase
MSKICTAAKEAGIAVVLGFSENEHNSLYIAQCVIDKMGEVVMKRRKMKPTHMERTFIPSPFPFPYKSSVGCLRVRAGMESADHEKAPFSETAAAQVWKMWLMWRVWEG